MDSSHYSGRSNYSIKPSLPSMKVNVPLALTSNKVFEMFSLLSKSTSFEIIEMEQSIATAVNKEPFSIRKMLLNCLPVYKHAMIEQEDAMSENPSR